MILPLLDELWAHVAWRPTVSFELVFAADGKAEVYYLNGPRLLLENQVVKFDVSVAEVLAVHVSQSFEHLFDDTRCLWFRQTVTPQLRVDNRLLIIYLCLVGSLCYARLLESPSFQMRVQIAPHNMFHDQIELPSRVNHIVQRWQVKML